MALDRFPEAASWAAALADTLATVAAAFFALASVPAKLVGRRAQAAFRAGVQGGRLARRGTSLERVIVRSSPGLVLEFAERAPRGRRHRDNSVVPAEFWTT